MSKKGIGWSSLSGRLTMLVEFCQSTRIFGIALLLIALKMIFRHSVRGG